MIPYKKQLLILEQMRDMFESNIPVNRILEAVAETPGVEEHMFDVLEEFRSGVQFHQAIANAEIFGEEINRIIEAAHESGDMVGGLNRAIELVEMEVKFRKALLSVLIYPAIVIAVAHAAVYAVLLFIIPKLERGMLKHIQNPSILLKAYVWASHNLPVVALLNVAVLVLIVIGIKKGWCFRLTLKLPGLSRVMKQRERTIFFSIVSTLYSANLPVKDVLTIATSRSRMYADYTDLAENIEHTGLQNLFQEMAEDGVIDSTHYVAVKSALESNTLKESFERISTRESENFRQMQANLAEIIRPLVQILVLLAVLAPIAPLYAAILSSAIDSMAKIGG